MPIRAPHDRSDEPSPSPAPPRPRVLLVAAALVALEGAVVVAFGGYLMAAGLLGRPSSLARAEIGGAMVLLLGVAVLAVARGMLRSRRWSRSPGVLVQVLCLPVAWGLAQGGRYDIGVPIGVLALALLVLLIGPAGQALRD